MERKQKRHFEVLYPIPTSIVYCDASNETPKCIEAVDGLAFPNGTLFPPHPLWKRVLISNLGIRNRQGLYLIQATSALPH